MGDQGENTLTDYFGMTVEKRHDDVMDKMEYNKKENTKNDFSSEYFVYFLKKRRYKRHE